MVVDNDIAFENQFLLRISVFRLTGFHRKPNNTSILTFGSLLNYIVSNLTQPAVWQVYFPGTVTL